MRELIYRRDHGLCVQCRSKDIIKIGDVVDHIVPIRVDWSKRLEPSNLQTLCHACHNKKTKEDEKKNKNNSKEKFINNPHHEKQKATLWRPPPSFPCKKFVLFYKRGSAKGGGSHRKKSEADSFAFIRR